jgi:cell wall-associated NlpC family hydrolase
MAGRRWGIWMTARRSVVVALLLGLPAGPALAAGPPATTSAPSATAPDPAGAAGTADLEAKALGLQARLDQQYDALERISEQYNKAIASERELRAKLVDVQARRKAVTTELAAAQDTLDQQARETYEAGPGWFVSELVGTADPADLLRRVPLQKAALEAGARNVQEVAKRKAELDGLTERAEAALAEQRRLDADVLSQHHRLDTLAKQLQATLKGIDKRLKGVLDAQERRAEAGRRAAFSAWFRTLGPRAQASWMNSGRAAAVAVAYAMRQLGKPYRWGAEGPAAFDCSGLTSAAYLSAGVVIPRVAVDQFNAGPHVAVGDLLPGDLVFYADNPAVPATIHHVGMYIGRGLMVHAPHTGDVVRIASIWRSGYAGAVRVVAGSPMPGVPPPPVGTFPPPPPPPMSTAPPPTAAPPTTHRPPSSTAPPRSTAPPTTKPKPSSTTTTSAPTTTAPPTTAAATTTTTAAEAGTTSGSAAASSSSSGAPPTTTTEPPTTTDPPTTTEPPTTEAPTTAAPTTTEAPSTTRDAAGTTTTTRPS